MRAYEEYETPEDKRRASRNATRGKPTGLAVGYCLVFDEHGLTGQAGTCGYDGIGENGAWGIDSQRPVQPRMIGHVAYGRAYLADNCRRIGRDAIPYSWRRALATALFWRIYDAWNEPSSRHYRQFIRSTMGEDWVSECLALDPQEGRV